jgi:copper chaperone CopZ
MKNQKNNSEAKWVGAGLFTAFAASLCCITPVAAFLAGISGAASAFSWLDPFRPYLIALTVMILGAAWYQKLKPRWDPTCACEENPSFWKTKSFLGIATVFAIALMSFPYYSDAFFPEQEQKVIYIQESQVQTTSLNITGMTCTGCEATVVNAAMGINGVLEVNASYEKHNATIKFDREKTNLENIIEAINKTGFTVTNTSEPN